jgi:hypothetical protein
LWLLSSYKDPSSRFFFTMWLIVFEICTHNNTPWITIFNLAPLPLPTVAAPTFTRCRYLAASPRSPMRVIVPSVVHRQSPVALSSLPCATPPRPAGAATTAPPPVVAPPAFKTHQSSRQPCQHLLWHRQPAFARHCATVSCDPATRTAAYDRRTTSCSSHGCVAPLVCARVIEEIRTFYWNVDICFNRCWIQTIHLLN